MLFGFMCKDSSIEQSRVHMTKANNDQHVRDLILSGHKMTTRDMCIMLGWQGGTIHQVADQTGLSVEQLLKAQS